MTGRERFFNMVKGRNVDHLPLMPITMQFACDRIAKKYGEYAADYRVLVEGQLRVAEEFDFDHISCISDPARETADCGGKVIYGEDAPPAIDHRNSLLADKSRLAGLKKPHPLGGGRMHDRIKAAALLKEKTGSDKIIEGWIEGPCAEAADLRGINTIMMDFFEDPGFVSDLFEFIIDMELDFARYQIEAGVDVMGIGDAAASLVGPKIYEQFIWPYEKKLIDGVHALGAQIRLHICGNIADILEGVGRLGCAFVDIDYPVPMSKARNKTGPAQILAGNINPVAVLQDGTPEQIYKAVKKCHEEAGDKFILAAGCEITRGTSPQNVRVLTDYAVSN